VVVIVSDLRMPGTDGVSLLAQVGERWPDITRIMITGEPRRDLGLGAFDCGGVHRLLLKPCAPDELLDAVADGVRHHDEVVGERAVLRHRTAVAGQDRCHAVAARLRIPAERADRTHLQWPADRPGGSDPGIGREPRGAPAAIPHPAPRRRQPDPGRRRALCRAQRRHSRGRARCPADSAGARLRLADQARRQCPARARGLAQSGAGSRPHPALCTGLGIGQNGRPRRHTRTQPP